MRRRYGASRGPWTFVYVFALALHCAELRPLTGLSMRKENRMCPLYGFIRMPVGRLLVLSFLSLWCCSAVCAQQAGDGAEVEKVSLQLLMKKIDQLEARISELESNRQPAGGVNHTSCPDPTNLPTTKAVLSGPLPKLSPREAPVTSQVPPPDSPPSRESEQAQAENGHEIKMFG